MVQRAVAVRLNNIGAMLRGLVFASVQEQQISLDLPQHK